MPFVKKQKPTESMPLAGFPSTVANHPAKDLKHYQRESSRARKRAEDIACQLDDAREELKRVSREALADDQLEASAFGAMMTAAQGNVSALEAALKIAQQQEHAADVALATAAQEARQEVEREDQARLERMAQAIDTWMNNGKPLFERYENQRKVVLAHGNLAVNQKVHDANLAFTTYLFRVCGAMSSCKNSYSLFQTDPKWTAPWSTHHPRPED